VRRRVGFLPEESALHGFLTCVETLELYGSLYDVPRKELRSRAAALLERVRLADAARKRVNALSRGMKRRLALAVALVGEPELLVLDEPTSGMDPLAREEVLGLFEEHVEGGGTLLVTSHLLGDIHGIARHATLLAEGRVARAGDLAELLRVEGVRSYRVRGGAELDAAVRREAQERGGEVLSAGPAHDSIEELFLDTYRDGGPSPPGKDAPE
jgi:ABC-2 type transport system ATP-binding protein